MADDADSRTQEATPRRLERAAREGEVWQPRELAPALALAVAAGCLTIGGGAAWTQLAAYLAQALAAAGDARGGLDTGHRAVIGAPVLIVLLVAAAGTLLHGLAGLAVARGWVGNRIAPKFARLNPLAGLKRLVSKDGLVAALLALAKLAAFAAAAWLLFENRLPVLLRLDGDLVAAGSVVGDAVRRLAFMAAALLAVLAAVEGTTSLRAFRAKLRMTPDEVRRESREDNGSPELKAAIRRSQLATASRRLRTTLKEATVVVVNPTHFAIAMRYRPGTDAAPVLLEKGRELTAQAIVDVARELAIPIVRAPRLARAVFFTGRIGDTVREELFGAVAIVIAYVLSFDARADLPAVAVPPEFDFDETGQRRKPGTPVPL